MLYDATPFSINPHLQRCPTTPRILQPVMLVGLTPMLLAVHKNSPFKSVQDLIQAGKQAPGG